MKTEDQDKGHLTRASGVCASTAREVFEAIKHGDEKHRAWLKGALEDYFAGRPVRRESPVAPTPPASSPVAGEPKLNVQTWPPGASLLQVAVAPHAAAGPYPTAMRPATAEEAAAIGARFATPVAPSVDAAWVEKAMELAHEMQRRYHHAVSSSTEEETSASRAAWAEYQAARATLIAHLSTALPAQPVPLVEKTPRVLNPMAEWPWEPSEGSK